VPWKEQHFHFSGQKFMPDRGGRFRQRERGTSHAKAFRQWLVQTVGLCRLCQGSGVLDIAGGKGQLSFELLNLQVPSGRVRAWWCGACVRAAAGRKAPLHRRTHAARLSLSTAGT